ncbi:hypothetical protein ASPVEDRAFT_36361 [Aspergillus versicolor CBS 583.65]|uniref:CBM6 domain-containing protein n=1 Tax=Aspergillus versicolor CBS 583.65 TaxID=1036611 RepID=A0A1L9P621_ASPVE|nr:uncharacterized protein ASPVEDRAFT_36361 [Aspergillus versicolor CBS 583.65]OJI96965.1 hypothetical protein ASPVEDRAFT_36361 [Aspergillus versicolor CBS 583.65]
MSSLLSLILLLSNINFSTADNPIVQTIYTADPAPLIHNNRFYLFTGHDEDASTTFNMLDWRLFSSSDMANWQHHRSPMSLDTFSWATTQAWAGQVIPRNDKFYFYVPVRHGETDSMVIGVGVSDTLEGPYEDAIGSPLLGNNEIDPTVFIDDDGQAYLYWGNPNLWYVKLNEDMVSYSGEITQVDLTTEGFGTRPEPTEERPTAFEEAPWLYKRDGLYYMVYAGSSCCPENIQYSTGPSATGPWSYGGVVMESASTSSTNHPGIVDYGNVSYFAYHNGELPGGGSFTRSVAVESFEYNEDGSIPVLQMTEDGPEQVAALDPFVRQEAETMAWSEGIETEECSEGGLNVCDINNGDYIKVRGVAFGDGAESFSASVASATDGGDIELRLDSEDGLLIGTCTVVGTGDWQEWTTVDCPVEATGTHDLFFKFVGAGDGFLLNFDWWQFE